MKKAFDVVAAVMCLTAVTGSALAHAAPLQPVATETTVRYQAGELASPAAARILLWRIGAAALESCGASSFSLEEFKVATIHSMCWKNAVADAVRRIDSPTLNAVAAQGGPV